MRSEGEGSGLRHMHFGMGNRFVIRGSRVAAIVMVLFCALHCDAQQDAIGQFRMNIPEPNNPVVLMLGTAGGGNWNAWIPGQSINLVISILENGMFVATSNEGPGDASSVSILQWPNYQTSYLAGSPDTNVTLSNLHYISATEVGFTATTASSASTSAVDQLDLNVPGGEGRWPIFFQAATPPSAPGTPGPDPNCGTPNITSVIPDTWIAGQTYPIKIMGTGFSSDAQAAVNPNCPANQLMITVPNGTVNVTSTTVVSSTEIDATVQPANTDPNEQATLTLYYHDANDDIVRHHTGPTSMVTTAKPQNTAPIWGWVAALPAYAQIGVLQAVITDTSNITNGMITVNLTGPNGAIGDLALNISGVNQNYTQTFQGLSPGSHLLKLALPNVPADTYDSADGTWTTNIQTVSMSSKNFAPDWIYLGSTRFSQYNTPYETLCPAQTEEMYVFNMSSCTYESDNFRAMFVSQTQLNGTGVSINWGLLKPLGATAARKLCNKSSLPPNASSANTFVEVDDITGSCNLPIYANHSVATYPNPAILSSQLQCNLHNSLNLDVSTNSQFATRAVADLCPACKDGHHIDSWTPNEACQAHGSIGDLGNFYISTK